MNEFVVIMWIVMGIFIAPFCVDILARMFNTKKFRELSNRDKLFLMAIGGLFNIVTWALLALLLIGELFNDYLKSLGFYD